MSRQRRGPAWLWSVPVGLQLSVIYAILFAAILALLGWALYGQLDNFLVQNTAERLQTFVRPVLPRQGPPWTGRPDRPGEPGVGEGEEFVPVQRADQIAQSLVRELTRSDVAIVVYDMSGARLAITAGVSDLAALPEGWLEQARSAAPDATLRWVLPNASGERQLVVLTPVQIPAREEQPVLLLLEQVTSLAPADAVLNQLRLYIVLGILIGTSIGVVAGLALTRAVLRPLDRMVGTAEAIAGGDLERRLRLPSGRNEVARLGSSFDHMVDRLGAALEAQKRFVADASHELRTPLTSMEGLSEMLLMGADRGDTRVVQRTVRSIHSELSRLSRLVTDLLTLSRLDSTVPMRSLPVDMARLVAEVAEQMMPLAVAKGVNLVTRYHDSPVALGEPDRLKQVLLNLLDNALRYTPEGGQVLVSVTAEGGVLHLDVEDTGPGIAAEDIPHLFDRFYRGDASRARATGNTGLGLSIAHAIVRAHRGAIEVRSTPGEGARFRVTLPLHAVARPTNHQPQAQVQAQAQAQGQIQQGQLQPQAAITEPGPGVRD